MAVDEFVFRAMASKVHVVVIDAPPSAGAMAQRALDQLESVWSRFIDTSDISRLNRAEGLPVVVDRSTLGLVEVMIEAWHLTEGSYDSSTLRALLTAGYTASISDPHARTDLPRSNLPRSGANGSERSLGDIQVDPGSRSVRLPAGMAIDPGGVGKGLAADLVVAELLARGAAGALVSIGGDMAAAGALPGSEGWTVDVEHHLDPIRTLARLSYSGGGIATSSTRSRRWTSPVGDQHHVIDPTTDEPSQTDLVAVTVLGTCGWHAEVHATAILLGGAAKVCDHAKRHCIEALATTQDGEVLASRGMAVVLPVEVAR